MISVEIASNPRQYKLTILQDENSKKERITLKNLPVSKEIIIPNADGIDLVDHYLMPREDIGEIIRRWPNAELSEMVQRDVRILDQYCTPLSDFPRHYESEYEFAISKHGGGQCDCHKDWQFAGQPTKDQKRYVLTDRRRCRTINAFLGGMGKGLTTLERARFLGTTRLFIATTNNMFEEWAAECLTVFGIEPLIVAGTPGKRKSLLEKFPAHKIVAVSYGLAHEIPMDGSFDQFIMDEGDMIANCNTDRFKRFIPIIAASWVRPGIGMQAATGTVYGNDVASIWFAYHLVHPYLAGTFESFKERYMEEISFKTGMAKKVDGNGYVSYIPKHRADVVITKNKSELKMKSAAAIIHAEEERNFNEGVKIVKCPLYPEQREVFKGIRSKTLMQVRDQEIDMRSVKNKFIKLQQCVEGIQLLAGRGLNISSKLDKARELLKKIAAREDKKKCLIFSRFRGGLDELAEEFKDISVSYNGDCTPVEKRMASIAFSGYKKPGDEEWFKKYSKEREFLFKPDEAQFMFVILHDLTARGQNWHKYCHTAIFLSIHDNPKANQQAYWRTVRHGQQHDTNTIYLQSDTEFEKSCFEIYLNKRADGQSILNPTSKKDQLRLILDGLRRDKLL